MNFLLLLAISAILILSSFLALRSKVVKDVKPVLLSVVITGVFFTFVSFLYHVLGVVSYAPNGLLGLYVAGLPLEQVLLCFIFPYSALVIHLILNKSFGIGTTDKYSLSISNVLMGLSIAMIFFAYSKWYTLITFSILLLTLFYIEYVNKIRFMLPFYRTFMTGLVLFLVVFIPLNSFEMVKHDVAQTIELKIAYIPFESYFGFFELSLISVFLLEFFKQKA
jgi:hypothetical protein